MNDTRFSSPESQGISSRDLLSLLKSFDERLRFPHGLVLRRHGHILSEAYWAPYRATEPHQLFSLSKSFTSSAIGIAQGEGLLSIDDPLLSFFPEYDTPAVGPLMRKVTLRHLLMMACGHKECPAGKFLSADPFCDLVQSFLELEPTYEPGTHFAYNSIGTYMLSAVLRKVTGQNLSDYLRTRLFEPLGIQTPVYWEKCLHHGTDMGGWGLWLTARDLSKAGELWLHYGRHGDRQLIPEAYVREATAWQIQNGPSNWPDWTQGYGFQFWQCQNGCFRGDGAYGQYIVMDRAHDTVFVLQSAIGDLQEPLTLLWEQLLPILHDTPLPEDPEALAELRAFEASRRSPSATYPAPTAPQQPVPARAWSVAENPLGLQQVALRPCAYGVEVAFRFFEYGIPRYATFLASPGVPIDSTTELVDIGHAVTVSADYAWLSPTQLRIMAICPGMVNRFTLDFTLAPDGSATIDYNGWFWFLHGDHEKATLTLSPLS